MKNYDVFERGSSSQIKVSVCAVFTTGSITVAGANQMTETVMAGSDNTIGKERKQNMKLIKFARYPFT